MELCCANRQIFKKLSLLEFRERHAFCKICVSKGGTSSLSVSPSEHGRNYNKNLVFIVLLIARLSQDLEDLLRLFQVRAALQVNYNNIALQHVFGEGLWLFAGIQNTDGIRGHRRAGFIFLENCAYEFMCLGASVDGNVVVTHFLE